MLSYATQLNYKREVIVKAYNNFSSVCIFGFEVPIKRFDRSFTLFNTRDPTNYWLSVGVWLSHKDHPSFPGTP